MHDSAGLSKSGLLNLSTTDILNWNVLGVQAVLHIVGCFAAILASTHWMAVTFPLVVITKNASKTLLSVSWGREGVGKIMCSLEPQKHSSISVSCISNLYLLLVAICWYLPSELDEAGKGHFHA